VHLYKHCPSTTQSFHFFALGFHSLPFHAVRTGLESYECDQLLYSCHFASFEQLPDIAVIRPSWYQNRYIGEEEIRALVRNWPMTSAVSSRFRDCNLVSRLHIISMLLTPFKLFSFSTLGSFDCPAHTKHIKVYEHGTSVERK